MIKTLEIRTSVVINLSCPNNTLLSCYFLFFFIIDLQFLIPAVVAQIFLPTVELVTLTGTQTSEVHAELETLSVTVEAKIRKFWK